MLFTVLLIAIILALAASFRLFYKQKNPRRYEPGVGTFFNVFYALGKQYTPTALEGKKEKRAERSVLCDFRRQNNQRSGLRAAHR